MTNTMTDIRYLNMREAGKYLGQSYRWMQRHWIDLIKAGVVTYRVPKDSPKGRLIFAKESLDKYMNSCQITADFNI